MKLWELRQKHEDDINKLLKKHGCVDPHGRLRRWNGPVMTQAMKEFGHTNLSYERCGCMRP